MVKTKTIAINENNGSCSFFSFAFSMHELTEKTQTF